MKSKVWFQAQIRWAVLEEGKRGLRSWAESAYTFLSDNEETAFQQALVMSRESRKHPQGRTPIGRNQTGGNSQPGLLRGQPV